MSAQSDIRIMELLELLDGLKHLKRTGWVHFNIPEPETVASHMYRMAILAMALAKHNPSSVDNFRVLKMALVHDISEAIVGDITPRCGVSAERKFELEEDAMKSIARLIPESIGEEWMELWLEYEAESTAEAIIVKQLDKLDVLSQALSYELKYNKDLSEFFDSTKNSFKTEPFVSWNAEIRKKRDELSRFSTAARGADQEMPAEES